MKIKGYPSVAHYLIHSFQKDKLRAEDSDDEDVNNMEEDSQDESEEESEKEEEEESGREEHKIERRAQKNGGSYESDEEYEDEGEDAEDDGSDYVDAGEEDDDFGVDEDEDEEYEVGEGEPKLPRRSSRRVRSKVVQSQGNGGTQRCNSTQETSAEEAETGDGVTEIQHEEKAEGEACEGEEEMGEKRENLSSGENDPKRTSLKPLRKRQKMIPSSQQEPPSTLEVDGGNNKKKKGTTKRDKNGKKEKEKDKEKEAKKMKGKDKSKEIKYNKGQLVCCWADPAYGDGQRFWVGKIREMTYKHARTIKVQWFEKEPEKKETKKKNGKKKKKEKEGEEERKEEKDEKKKDGGDIYVLTSEVDSIPAASIFRTNFEPKFVAISKRRWRLAEDLSKGYLPE